MNALRAPILLYRYGPFYIANQFFLMSLRKALNMHLHFTSSYHPEGDGQTEHANQTLKQYLQSYCNYQQDNRSELLPLAEFAYNNAPSATTRVSPFFANKGYVGYKPLLWYIYYIT